MNEHKTIRILIAVSALILAFSVGWWAGRLHVIYTQEIYTENGSFTAVIDGSAHLYD